MKRHTPRFLAVWLAALALLPSELAFSQSALSEAGVGDDDSFLIELEAYVKYGGDIVVIDGLTGLEYHRESEVVKTIHANLPKIMGGLHNRLLLLEAQHMNFLMTQGVAHVKKLADLAESFGIKGHGIDKEQWLLKERTILARLRSEPFFQIKELVVWEKESLSAVALRGNERAKHLRYNPDEQRWERRILTEWKVGIRNRNNYKMVRKWQGLNLDTNEGFHISDTLPGNVYVSAFNEVPVSFPIIVSREENADEQIARIQQLIVKNLSYLYDPFSWAGRRSTRFRGRFVSDLLRHMENRSYRVNDREWFDRTICNFLNDIVTVEMYGLKEVYNFYVTRRFENNRSQMGIAMDPLNWVEGEDRPTYKPRKVNVRFNFNNPDGARFVLLDLYLRYGYKFAENLRTKLVALKKKESGKEIVMQSIEEVTGKPARVYIKAAEKAQAEGVLHYWETDRKGGA